MSKPRPLDLRSCINDACLGNCSGDERKQVTENDLCGIVSSQLDGGPVRCVGDWALQKIFHLVQYFGIFSQGMKLKWEGNLNYLEICSGPGRCICRENKEEIDGTALAIINHEHFPLLRSVSFVDNNPKVVEALSQRILNAKMGHKARAVVGDYSDSNSLSSILTEIPKNCLNFALIDPTDCGVPFAALRQIKNTLGKVDFIINIAIFTDATRNLRRTILDPKKFRNIHTKYSGFLGDMDFLYCDKMKRLAARDGTEEDLREKFIERYISQLNSLGLVHTDKSIHVKRKGKSLYVLLFASEHSQGLNFWRQVHGHNETGQTSFLNQLN